MKVKVIRQFLNGRELTTEGETIDVTVARAADLEKNGLVVPIVGSRTAEAAGGGAADPTVTAQDGGPTGEEGPASSSRRGRQRSGRRSRRAAAEPAT